MLVIILVGDVLGMILSVMVGLAFVGLRIFVDTTQKSIIYDNGIRFKIKNKDREIIHNQLEHGFDYYYRLTKPEKDKFISKLVYFMSDLEFVPTRNITITREMAVQISASFVQLAFGLEKNLLNYFTVIFVFPEAYFHPGTQKYHIGEVNLRGVITLSWRDYQLGYAISDDAINVGLHEMAHALYFEIIQERYQDPELFKAIMKIYQRAKNEINNTWKQGTFMRRYAYTNPPEYFAVAMEYFFEKPELFAIEEPALFYELTDLLKQNPLRK